MLNGVVSDFKMLGFPEASLLPIYESLSKSEPFWAAAGTVVAGLGSHNCSEELGSGIPHELDWTLEMHVTLSPCTGAFQRTPARTEKPPQSGQDAEAGLAP